MAERYSVEAYLEADNSNFMEGFRAASQAARDFSRDINNLDTRGIQDAGRQFEKVGKKMQTTGKDIMKTGGLITAGVTLPIVGAAAASVNSAIEFESAFAGVRKTVDATEAEFSELEAGIRNMAKELPASTTEIAAVGEAAGQLGIKKENILDFTRTMIDLGEATNLTSEEAASSMAQFANVVQMPQESFDRLGSSIVALGNTMATTEADILSMGMRLAGTGAQIGLTEAEIMALAAAMSSVGIEAEAGGSAMSTVMKKIQNAVGAGGEELAGFAAAAGVSSSEFAASFENEPIVAIDTFIKGLAESGAEGENLNNILADLGIKGIRETDTLLRLAGASDILSDAVGTSNSAWEENTALSDEAAQRYATTESQIAIMKNRFNDLAITIGNILLPFVNQFLEFLAPIVERVSNASEKTQKLGLMFAAAAAAIGPLVTLFGGIIFVVGSVIANFGSLITKFAPIIQSSATLTKGVGLLTKGFSLLTGPVGIAIAVIMALIPVFIKLYQENETVREIVSQVWEAIKTAIQIAIDAIKPIIESLKEAFTSMMPILELIAGIVGGVLVAAFGIAISIFSAVAAAIAPVIDAFMSIVEVVTNVVMSVVSLLTGDFQGALDYWNQAVESTIEVFKSLWDGVVAFISTFVETIIDFFHGLYMTLVGGSIVPDMVNAIVDWFKNLGTWVIDLVKSLVSSVVDWFKDLWTKTVDTFNSMKTGIQNVWNAIKSVFETVVTVIVNLVRQKFDEMKSKVSNIINSIRDTISNVWNAIKSLFSSVLSTIVSTVSDKFNSMRSKVSDITSTIKSTISTAWEAVKTTISNAVTNAVSTVSDKFDAMKRAVTTKMTLVRAAIRDKWNEVMSFLRGINLFQMGKNIIQGLINGVKNMGSTLVSAAKGVVNSAIDGAKALLGIRSPSRVFMEIGGDTMAGFVQGIDSMAGNAVRSVSSMAQDVTGAFNPDLSIGKHDYSNHIKGMQGQLSQTITSQVSSKLSVNRQPAQINMTLGGRSYKAFVEDITNGQTQQVNLVEKYGGG